ncbi:MAG: response regulator transcription factor [Thermomicrobiales bacterium]
MELVLPHGPTSDPGEALLPEALELQRLAVLLALDANDLDCARAWLMANDRWRAWSGSVLWRAEGMLGWSAYHHAMGDRAQAREHAERALAHAMGPRQPIALLAAHRALGELNTMEERYADATNYLTAALALADACAAPYERALCLLALADLQRAMGEHHEARASLAEARTILEPLGARPALSRADTLTTALDAMTGTAIAAPLPAGLSAREAEVLRLVAQGCSNAEIAARLFLSPRTVTTHLTAIYTKLGVENRAAATAFAIDHGLR